MLLCLISLLQCCLLILLGMLQFCSVLYYPYRFFYLLFLYFCESIFDFGINFEFFPKNINFLKVWQRSYCLLHDKYTHAYNTFSHIPLLENITTLFILNKMVNRVSFPCSRSFSYWILNLFRSIQLLGEVMQHRNFPKGPLHILKVWIVHY